MATSQKSSKSDKELKKMEKEISSIFSQYEKEMSEKWDGYFKKIDDQLSAYQIAMREAYKSGDKSAIQEATSKYREALQTKTIYSQEYKTMVSNTAYKMANVNQIALDYVNDKMPSVYAFSYNALDKQVDNIKGYSFDLVDESTVKKLAQQKEIQLPKKQLDVSKDTQWNAKQINAQMMQGILQGEPISQIAKRFQTVSDMNKSSAKRNARTMYTSCENAGRQDSYEQASADGVIMHKVWMSAQDDRTRESHIEADGQEVDIDEPFILINRDGSVSELMYPADPNGDPEQVYNCRCTMITKIVGFRKPESDDKSTAEEDAKAEPQIVEEPIVEEQIEAEPTPTETNDENSKLTDEQIVKGENEAVELQTIEEPTKEEIQTAEAEEKRSEKWFDGLTTSEKSVMETYVAGDGMEVNNYLRERGYYRSELNRMMEGRRLEEDIAKMDSAIEKFGGLSEQTLYRSVDLSAVTGKKEEYGAVYDLISGDRGQEKLDALVGKQITDKGYMSTTSDASVATGWGDFTGSENPIVIEFEVPEGTAGASLAVLDIAEDAQKETLLARNTTYEITSATVAVDEGEDEYGKYSNKYVLITAKIL